MSAALYKIECPHGVIIVSFPKGSCITPDLIIKVIERENAMYDVTQCNAIWDFKGCLPSDDFGYNALESIIYYISSHSEIQWKSKMAIVIDAEVQYGLSRMYQSLVENYPTNVGIFYSQDEAFAWLDGEASAVAREDGIVRNI